MTMHYRHTQRGTVILAATATAAALFMVLIIASLGSWPATAGVVAGMSIGLLTVVVTGWYFSSMTIEVTDDEVRWHFGPGWNFRVARAEIEGAQIARHPWWGGYGIRFRGPNRWIHIIAGRDLVEVRLRNGGWRRLGTDDPQGLAGALNSLP